MINYPLKDLFFEDSVKKDLIITDGEITLTNEDIYEESLSITESLCSNSEIVFGSCEASRISFTTSYLEPLINKVLSVSIVLNDNTDTPFIVGTYTVTEDKLTADRSKREVVAYDSLYSINNTDFSDWYNSLSFPLTLKSFRDSFFAEAGVQQESITLPNDNISIEKTIDTDTLSGANIVQAICEINGCFGHISRDNKFCYIKLKEIKNALYPSKKLLPSKTLYPSRMSGGSSVSYDPSLYITAEYSDYVVQKIDKLQIRTEENDIGVIVGSGDNSYVIEDNFLLYGKTTEALTPIANNILDVIKIVEYRPLKFECISNPCVEVSDGIAIRLVNGELLKSYMLMRTISGIQSLRDSVEALGEEYRSEQVNGIAYDIKQLKGRSNVLERSIEETKSTIADVEQGLQSQITQQAGQIQTKVSAGEVVSTINQSAEQITLNSNRLVVNSTNFKLSKEGNVECSNLKVTGGEISIPQNTTGAYVSITRDNGLVYGSEWGYGDLSMGSTTKINNTGLSVKALTSLSSTDFKCNVDVSSNGMRVTGNVGSANYGMEVGGIGVSVTGALIVSGYKARVVDTKHYGKRLQNAYETCEAYFGDIGEGETDENGICIIPIDEIFAETVSVEYGYQVFLQKYGEGDIYVAERNNTEFVIKGTPNLKFGWEMKARQKGYETDRLKELSES